MNWFGRSKQPPQSIRDIPTETLRVIANTAPQYRYQCIELDRSITEEELTDTLNAFAHGCNVTFRSIDIGEKTFLILTKEVSCEMPKM